MVKLLVTRPRHDVTLSYLFYWSEEIIDFAKNSNISFTDFKGEKVIMENIEKFLRKQNPRLAVFNGHGDDSTIYGHNNEPIIAKGKNEELLKTKIIYAIACNAAKRLGENAVKKGCDAFIGYENRFGFVRDPSRSATPSKDKLAEPFKQFSNTITMSILKGNSVGKAVEKAKKVASELIKKYSVSEVEPGYREIRFWLFWDRFFLKSIGNLMAKFL